MNSYGFELMILGKRPLEDDESGHLLLRREGIFHLNIDIFTCYKFEKQTMQQYIYFCRGQ